MSPAGAGGGPWRYSCSGPPQTQLADYMARACRRCQSVSLGADNRAELEVAIRARALRNNLDIDDSTFSDGNCGPDAILRNLERLQVGTPAIQRILEQLRRRGRLAAIAAMRLMLLIWVRNNAQT